ncbi:MAG: PqqD family peptide modification chaperone [Halobacteriota archaeon]
MKDVLKRADDLQISEVRDGYIIYQSACDRVHYLNKTAAIVFELCDGKVSMRDVICSVADLFELDDTHDEEIKNCIDSLLREGLVLSHSK